MLKATFKRKTTGIGISDLRKRLRSLERSKVQAGYFQSQGMHPFSNISFVELIGIHEYGLHGITRREPMAKIGMLTRNTFKEKCSSYMRDYVSGEIDTSELLDKIGYFVNENAYTVFGNPNYLPVTNNPTPLVDTGILSDMFSFKTTKSRKLKSLPDRNFEVPT